MVTSTTNDAAPTPPLPTGWRGVAALWVVGVADIRPWTCPAKNVQQSRREIIEYVQKKVTGPCRVLKP